MQRRRWIKLALLASGAHHVTLRAMGHAPQPSTPLSLLTEVPADRFGAEFKGLEQGLLALLAPSYEVTQRHAYLAPNGTWVAYVQQADQAAQAWKGVRQPVPGRRVGIDLVELWRNPASGQAAALTMTAQAVDTQGHYLLGYFWLAPRKGPKDRVID